MKRKQKKRKRGKRNRKKKETKNNREKEENEKKERSFLSLGYDKIKTLQLKTTNMLLIRSLQKK